MGDGVSGEGYKSGTDDYKAIPASIGMWIEGWLSSLDEGDEAEYRKVMALASLMREIEEHTDV